MLFNYSNLKAENELLKKGQTGGNSTQGESTANITSDQFKSKRPQTAKIKEADKMFRKSVNDLNLFKMNPLFDEEDLLEKFNFNLKPPSNNNFSSFATPMQEDINSLLNFDDEKNVENQKHYEDYADLQEDESDEELKDILNKSIQNLKLINDIKLENQLHTKREIDPPIDTRKPLIAKNTKPRAELSKPKANSIFNKPIAVASEKEAGNPHSSNKLPTLKLKSTRLKSKDPVLLREANK